jgi:hypothetical protein
LKRHEFEHVVRAAAEIVEDEVVVIGSQAILGQYPDPPNELLRSMELDVYPRNDPDRAGEIDGAIGDGSPFHRLYHYYAHGVGPETAIAPAGWENRLVRLELAPLRRTRGNVVVWCLDVHDLVLAKLAAGREHDLEFVEQLMRSGLADLGQLELGIEWMPDSHRELTRGRLAGLRRRIESGNRRHEDS